MDSAVLVDPKVNIKESEKMDKYLNLASELKEQLNVKVTVVQIIVSVL